MPNCIESAITFLSNNAYIVTAVDGLPFIAAGKRAVNLMFTNFGEKITSELVGGAVFWICKFTIFFISMGYVLLKVSFFLIFNDKETTTSFTLGTRRGRYELHGILCCIVYGFVSNSRYNWCVREYR